MITTSLWSISEQVKDRLGGKGDIQTYISAVIDALGTAVKNEWFQGKNDGVSEIAGQFLYPFGKTTPLLPVLDSVYGLYYITIPSSYVSIPCEIGISSVSYAKGKSFVRLTSAEWRNYLLTKAGKALGGRQAYFTEDKLMYFPKMNASEAMNIYLVLAVAYSTINPRDQINISPNVKDVVIDIVVAKYSPQPPVLQDNTVA